MLRTARIDNAELRPHANVLIVAFQALGSNVATVMHSVEVTQADRGVRVPNCLSEAGAGCGHAKHAAARRLDSLRADPGACMKDSGARCLRLFDPRDWEAGLEVFWISPR